MRETPLWFDLKEEGKEGGREERVRQDKMYYVSVPYPSLPPSLPTSLPPYLIPPTTAKRSSTPSTSAP